GRAANGTQSLYYGQDEVPNGGGQGDYDLLDPVTDQQKDNEGTATTPTIVLPGAGDPAYVTFNYFLQTENDATRTYDQATVSVIDTATGNSYPIGNNRAGTLLDPTPVFHQFRADLGAFAGHSIKLRFAFTTYVSFPPFADTRSQKLNDFEGWYVDDVKVSNPVIP